MEYIKDPKMIEVRSFEIIQGIIDDIDQVINLKMK